MVNYKKNLHENASILIVFIVLEKIEFTRLDEKKKLVMYKMYKQYQVTTIDWQNCIGISDAWNVYKCTPTAFREFQMEVPLQQLNGSHNCYQ